MKMKRISMIAGISIYAVFVLISFGAGFAPGKQIGMNFLHFLGAMLKILPCAFILVGLFEVWVKTETVTKHLGDASGIKGYGWAILLAGTIAGGLYVAFPVANSLRGKGASWSVIFTYLGAVTVCRIPMTIFEASFLGIKFTIIRLLTALPLIIITSILLGRYFSTTTENAPNRA